MKKRLKGIMYFIEYQKEYPESDRNNWIKKLRYEINRLSARKPK